MQYGVGRADEVVDKDGNEIIGIGMGGMTE